MSRINKILEATRLDISVANENNQLVAKKYAKMFVENIGDEVSPGELDAYVTEFKQEFFEEISAGENAEDAWERGFGEFLSNAVQDEQNMRSVLETVLDAQDEEEETDESAASDALLDKVRAETLMDFDKKIFELKKYVDGILKRRTSQNLDDMIGNVADNLEKFAQEIKGL